MVAWATMVHFLRYTVPLWALTAILAQGPEGYRAFQNKTAPVQFHYPSSYQEVPLPPTEQLGVAKLVAKDKPIELKKVQDRLYKAVEQQLHVFYFEAAGPATGAEPAAKEAPSTVREAMEQGSRVTNWEDFCKRLANWELQEDARKPGVFTLTFRGNWPSGQARPVGYLIRKTVDHATFGVYGFSLEPAERLLQTQVTKVANTLRPSNDTAAARAEAAIDRLYENSKLRALEFRKQARRELAQGWKALDTENYLIVHHSKNESLIQKIGREIEAMRALYTELFPPSGPMDKLSVVRVCRTMEEYHQYGGPPNTGGYWHSGNEELVFFDYSYTMKTLDEAQRKAMGNRKLTDDDTLLVLYHEAFHQYIYYAVGEVSPHDWFNEGYGDYFSGADITSAGKVAKIDPSSWRIHLAKDMCEHGEGFIPLEEILRAERAVFYNPARIKFFYAGAWSFVYFLRTSKEVAAHPQWSNLLATYFNTVKQSYHEQLAKLEDAPSLQQKQVAAFEARKQALATTLAGLDLPALEQAWRKYVVEMKDPWPQQRKKRK